MQMLNRKQHGGASAIFISAVVVLATIYVGSAMVSSNIFKSQYNQLASDLESKLPYTQITRNEISSGIFSTNASMELRFTPDSPYSIVADSITINTQASHGLWFDDVAGLSFVRANIYTAVTDKGINDESSPLLQYAKGFGNHKIVGERGAFSYTFREEGELYFLSFDKGYEFNAEIDGDETLVYSLNVPNIELSSGTDSLVMEFGEVNGNIPETESELIVGDFEMLIKNLNFIVHTDDSGVQNQDLNNIRVTSNATFVNGLHSGEATLSAENKIAQLNDNGDTYLKFSYKNISEQSLLTIQELSNETDELTPQVEAALMEVVKDMRNTSASIELWPVNYTTEAGGAELRLRLGLNKPADGQSSQIDSAVDLLQSLIIVAEFDVDQSLLTALEGNSGDQQQIAMQQQLVEQEMSGLLEQGFIMFEDNRYFASLNLNNNRLRINGKDAPELMGLLLMLSGEALN